ENLHAVPVRQEQADAVRHRIDRRRERVGEQHLAAEGQLVVAGGALDLAERQPRLRGRLAAGARIAGVTEPVAVGVRLTGVRVVGAVVGGVADAVAVRVGAVGRGGRRRGRGRGGRDRGRRGRCGGRRRRRGCGGGRRGCGRGGRRRRARGRRGRRRRRRGRRHRRGGRRGGRRQRRLLDDERVEDVPVRVDLLEHHGAVVG